MSIIDLIVVFVYVMMYLTKLRRNGWLLLARASSRKRKENLVVCYSYWPMSSTIARDTLIEQSLL